jgi:hypothetical protein
MLIDGMRGLVDPSYVLRASADRELRVEDWLILLRHGDGGEVVDG